jgi:hypothetical protein
MRFLAKPLLLLSILSVFACSDSRHPEDFPSKILWAWERPEDLRFIDTKEFGVAFLAQTLTMHDDEIIHQPRRQPLQIADGTYLIAVTRIESARNRDRAPALSAEQQKSIVQSVKKTVELANVKGVQIDFDALLSERAFYSRLLAEVRKASPENYPLTITALTSWCVGDGWLNELPIDDAIPMIFDMGPDQKAVTDLLAKGNDWHETVCKNSYGVSLDARPPAGLRQDRRFYYFKSAAWQKHDLDKIKSFHEK